MGMRHTGYLAFREVGPLRDLLDGLRNTQPGTLDKFVGTMATGSYVAVDVWEYEC